MGLTKEGGEGPNYTPGVEILAGTTILAEGCRGSISKQLIQRFKLDAGKAVPTYGLGFKELWQLPPGRAQAGLIRHSAGWPLDGKTYGGSFLYHLDLDRVYVGYVVGLDYHDPRLQPFEAFQQFKHHPSVKPLFDGGEILAAGARTIAAGGWQSLPKLEMPGALLIGDAGGTLNVPKIKGIHQAIRSGVCAAEHLAECGSPAGFDARWRASAGGRELYRVRNIKPGFKRGFWWGFANGALGDADGGPLAVDALQPARRWRAARAPRCVSIARSALGDAHAAAARSPVVGVLRRQHARGEPAGAPEGRRYLDLRDALRAGIRQSVRAFLPGERLRDGR